MRAIFACDCTCFVLKCTFGESGRDLEGTVVSDVVRLRTFPETEVRAWLKALYSPDSYDDGALEYGGITLENGADGPSAVVISAAKPAAKSVVTPVARPVAPPATAHNQPAAPPQRDRGQPIECTTVERTTVERTGAEPPSRR